ncbi:lipoyl amidotransferase LIPT1, mitochondrial [Palaemon carinicauda]|uniref:lipoyl amidotransferase LIPT1, mitochondrial n=1 Tax=Palaemon carinicauda TaxID=392227 RepID=UPI0035B5DCC9
MMSMRKLGLHLPQLYGGAVSSQSAAAVAASAVVTKRRQMSTKDAGAAETTKLPKTLKRVVFISQSTNVFANLAFEAWMYKNWCFDKRQVLFLWRNSPCVVIGRHQNPMVEANLPYLSSAGVPVARRNSGGGTVYHDEGNLNCTFFTARDSYNRKENLAVICRALQDDFGIEASVNERDDIIVEDQFKVSGSAAKLGRTSAYHHCSLLVKADKRQLKLALQGDKTIDSKATASVPAPVVNLSELKDDLTVDQLLTSIGRSYLHSSNDNSSLSPEQLYQRSNGYTLINPSEDWFPGLQALQEELSSKAWLHEKTPRFTITRQVTLPECIAHDTTVNVSIQAYHGHIEEVKVVGHDACPDVADLVQEVGKAMKGSQFSMNTFPDLVNRMRLPQPLRTQRVVV